jgi:hypothetical protein
LPFDALSNLHCCCAGNGDFRPIAVICSAV